MTIIEKCKDSGLVVVLENYDISHLVARIAPGYARPPFPHVGKLALNATGDGQKV